MSSYVDKMFINRVSGSLRNFKWKKETLANCSCPICGDSTKKASKARGYFYQMKNDFFYKCHNCNFSTTLCKFLEKVSPELSKEYSMERWKAGDNHHSNYKKPKEEELFKFTSKPAFKKKDKLLQELSCLNDLSAEHVAVKFANIRRIPKEHWKYLYYTEDFGRFMKEFLWGGRTVDNSILQ